MAIEQIDETKQLLKYLLALELWRGGLTQKDIKKRLGISSTAVTEMLKGVSRSPTASAEASSS